MTLADGSVHRTFMDKRIDLCVTDRRTRAVLMVIAVGVWVIAPAGVRMAVRS